MEATIRSSSSQGGPADQWYFGNAALLAYTESLRGGGAIRMQLGTITIVGVGLIGGSIGLAIKRRRVAERVIGVGWRQQTLTRAHTLGAIDEGSLEIGPAVADADLVIFCTPVQVIAAQILEAAPSYKKHALLTDAGSTKATITAAVDGHLPEGVYFVGSHPLAGSEKRGPEHADADLFQQRLTVITPTPQSDQKAVGRVCQFWKALGSRVKLMTPQEHDQALALTSHLPHLVAAALAGILPAELQELTATGFRDTTRIAAGDPGLWTGIFLHNRQALLEALTRISDQLDRFQTALTTGEADALTQLLDQAKKVRDALGS
jgi:prephenate dehydrogenase